MYNYNNYQNYIPNYTLPAQQDERIWVQNETSAEAYLVAPNGFVRLWDSSKPVFYEKRADATGRPLPLEVYEYTKKAHTAPLDNEANNSILDAISGLDKRIKALEEVSNGHTDITAIPEV